MRPTASTARLTIRVLRALVPTLTAFADLVTEPLRTYGLGEPHHVAVSPDARHLATAGPSGAFLWDRGGDALRHRLEPHGWHVSAITFSPDSRVLVSASHDRLIRAWDVDSGRIQRTFAGHQGEILNLAFAPDGQTFVSASADNTARVWSVETGELLQSLEVRGAFIHAAVFTPEGKRLVTAASAPADRIRLWDLATGATLRTFADHAWHTSALAFLPGGELVSAGDDLLVRIWNVETGELVRTLAGATISLNDLAISADGAALTVGCGDGRVIQWDVKSGDIRHQFKSGVVHALALIPGANQVATAGTDNYIREWDVESGAMLRTWEGHCTSTTLGVAFSPDGRQVLSGGGEAALRLWDRATSEPVRALEGHGGGTATVAFSADGHRVLSTRGAPQPAAQLWSTETGELVRDFAWPTGWPMCAALSRDSTQLATGAQDGLVRLWEVATGHVLRTLSGPSAWVTSVAISPDGTRLAGGGSSIQPAVYLWDAASGQVLHTFELEAGSVKALAFSPDGSELLVGWEDGYLRCFNTTTGERNRELAVPAAFLNDAVYSPGGEFILTGEGWPFFTARLLDAETGEVLRIFAGHKAPVESVAFDADGVQVLTGSDRVRLWDIADLAARLRSRRTREGMELTWRRGTLERATSPLGPWESVREAVSPWRVTTDTPAAFYRVAVAAAP